MKVLAPRLLTGLVALSVLCPAPAAWADAPSLSLVSVGISKYQYVKKLLSAHKDAQDVANVFKAQEGKLFGQVQVKTLIDSEANAGNIRQALYWAKEQAKPGHYTVVFMAGHGDSRTTGEFEFQAVDYHPTKKKYSNMPWKSLKNILQGLPGTTLVILDSCAAGAVSPGDNLVVLCACQPHKISDERAHNGYFTSALVEALSGKADANGDGTVTLAEVRDYVTELVPKTTRGKQLPMMVRPGNTVSALLPLAQLKAAIPPARLDMQR